MGTLALGSEIDAAAEEAARRGAAQGTTHARAAGLPAEARVARRSTTPWETIIDQSAEVDADLIVLGSRGLTGVKSLLLGSVSRSVLQHADRSVVVPTSEVTAERFMLRRPTESHEN